MWFWDIPIIPSPSSLNHINILYFWSILCLYVGIRIYTLCTAQPIIHQQKWSGIVVEFPTKPPGIKVKPHQIALIACYGKSTRTTHMFFKCLNVCLKLLKPIKKWFTRHWAFFRNHPTFVSTSPSNDFRTTNESKVTGKHHGTWWNIGKFRPRLEQTESPSFKTTKQKQRTKKRLMTW